MKMQRAMEWSVVDYINTSHPNFIGGNKAVEVASHQVRSNRLASPTSRQRDGVDSDAVAVSGSNRRSNAIVARSPSNGISVDQASIFLCSLQRFYTTLGDLLTSTLSIVCVSRSCLKQGVRSVADVNGNGSSGSERGSNWRIASFFRGREVHNPAVDISRSNTGEEIINHKEHVSSIIHLREPPLSLNSSEMHSEHEAEALAVTKQLLESYYSIVREKIQDSVPKAIMHFLLLDELLIEAATVEREGSFMSMTTTRVSFWSMDVIVSKSEENTKGSIRVRLTKKL
ncbi:Dynamin [Cynara cardunculus var. scolymus]|uniref:Dynamin n=1 Tax=Cynara cardunculus var. scolymus TaxID=59895 RepID=A0A118K571_CYNCS|nr:Dynamin [Cynara cardunculus var. scolymus]